MQKQLSKPPHKYGSLDQQTLLCVLFVPIQSRLSFSTHAFWWVWLPATPTNCCFPRFVKFLIAKNHHFAIVRKFSPVKDSPYMVIPLYDNSVSVPFPLVTIQWNPHIHVPYRFSWILSTVGSQLSKPRLSISKHLDVCSRHHVFGSSGKKTLRSLEFCYIRKQSRCRNNFHRMLQCLFIKYGTWITIYDVWASRAKPWTL